MKDYNEVAQGILRRRDQYVANRRRQIKRVTATVSCFCLVALVGFGAWQGGLLDPNRNNPPYNPPVTEHGEGEHEYAVNYGEDVITATVTDGSSKEDVEFEFPATLPEAHFNQASLPADVVYQEFDLPGDDFTAMPYTKLLTYYDVELPIEDLFSHLYRDKPEQDSYGIYRNDAREIYYDKNCIAFTNGDGTMTLNIAFSKAAHRPNLLFSLVDTELQFTEINGRQLAIFQYTGEADAICYYAEFLQDGVGWYVDAAGMDEDDFLRVLLAVVEEADVAAENTVSGTIISVDAYAGRIGVKSEEDGTVYGVLLPDTLSADGYALGNEVSVSFTGEPASIQTVWPQQLTNIEHIG